MEILIPSSVSRVPFYPQFRKTNKNPARTLNLHCSRGDNRIEEDVFQNQLKLNNNEENKTKDIWSLFKEAQQNIFYLNKQRLLAMEELEKVKAEKKSLLDRIELLEVKNQSRIGRDYLSISSELLLRIDSLVLTGMIDIKEASNIRKVVINSKGSLRDDLQDILRMNDSELLAALRSFSDQRKSGGFHIIHICTEMSPVVSVGSLASYVTGISSALQRRGNLVEIILPKYSCLKLDEIQGLREIKAEFYSYFNGQLHGNRIWTGVVCGIGVTFIQPIYYSSLFSQDRVYGFSNDFERFSYFSRASLDYLIKSGKRPDVLHIHNWQTSIVGPLFWDVHVHQGLVGTKILLTCQNFDSQCLEKPEKVAICGLDPSVLHRLDRLQDDKNRHLVNILKGGVVYSNKVIIMSSTQSKGQVLNGFGHGLEPTLAVHREKLTISPHGLDRLTWDPSSDNFLPQNYSADDMTGKSVCKVTLQQRLNLSEGISNILVGCIYSEFSKTDLDKLKALVSMSSPRDVQFAFMITNQSLSKNMSLILFQEEVKDDNVRFIENYDEKLAHMIISGSDIMLCPSFDDPLLHIPLKALKYGAVPIPLYFSENLFRRMGDPDTECSNFSQYIVDTFGTMSLNHAIDETRNNPSEWLRKVEDAMRKDFSWDAECSDVHLSVYESLKTL